jgi:uncharacterized protein (TIGR02757 family)
LTLKHKLDLIHQEYNQREFVSPDPLEFLYAYPQVRDREIAGLVAALLAYGRVAQILKSVARVLDLLGPSPHEYLLTRTEADIVQDLKGFKHRFTTDGHMTDLLVGAGKVLHRFGSLEACFLSGFSSEDETVIPAMSHFIKELTRGGKMGILAADPERRSACKRNNLFLRWMVRKDQVDPGGWAEVPSSALVVPLDTHMFRIGTLLGFTRQKQANLKTALEITRGFRDLIPNDPVKYDFCLTRFGIRGEMNHDDLKAILSNDL